MVEFGSCPYWVFTKLRVDIMDVITKCSLLKILPSSLFVSTVNPLFIIQLKKMKNLRPNMYLHFLPLGEKEKLSGPSYTMSSQFIYLYLLRIY